MWYESPRMEWELLEDEEVITSSGVYDGGDIEEDDDWGDIF